MKRTKNMIYKASDEARELFYMLLTQAFCMIARLSQVLKTSEKKQERGPLIKTRRQTSFIM